MHFKCSVDKRIYGESVYGGGGVVKDSIEKNAYEY